jgi:hypothetical protein
MKKLKTLTVFLLCLILMLPIKVTKVQAAEIPGQNVNTSTWLWNTSEIVTNSDTIIQFLLTNKVSTVYLQIDYSLDLAYYKSFIGKASANNIKVHALEGSTEWVSSGGGILYNNFFTWLNNYQRSSEAGQQFTGVHLDVEPYGNKLYSKSPNKVLENYQQFLISALDSCSSLNLELNIDIPFWFNTVQYKNKYGKGNLAEWIFQRVKNVTIMAYRDTAEGANGIIKISEAEMNLCKKYNVKATLAVETGRLDETPFVTFYEEGLLHMYTQLDIVRQYYSSHSSFNGFAVHYLENWMTMK